MSMRLCECGNELESEFDDVCQKCFEKLEADEESFRPLKFDDDGYIDDDVEYWDDDWDYE